jgi:transcriptional regulator
MYLPTHFAQTDQSALHALMQAHPLATLVTPGPDGQPVADLLPLRLVPGQDGAPDELQGHVARANPLWRHADGQPVLLLFHGPQAYVTPSWYASKARHGKVVPTWNYAIVEARATSPGSPTTTRPRARRPGRWTTPPATTSSRCWAPSSACGCRCTA